MPEDLIQVPGLFDDGNIFAIVGKARKALRRAGRADDAEKLTQEIKKCDYDGALFKVMEYVEEACDDE